MIFIKLHSLLYGIISDNNIISWLICLMLLWRPLYFLQINLSKRYSKFVLVKYVRFIALGLTFVLGVTFFIGVSKFHLGNKLFTYFLELLLITEIIGGIIITFIRQFLLFFDVLMYSISKYFGLLVHLGILFLEIYLLSSGYSFFLIKHTDLIFQSEVVNLFFIVTFCIYIYALVISSAVWILNQKFMIDLLDDYLDYDLFKKQSVKVATTIFTCFIVIGSFHGFLKSNNETIERNDGYGIFNTISDLDIMPVMNDYLEIAQDLNVNFEKLKGDTTAFSEWETLSYNYGANLKLIMDTLQ